MQSKNNSRRTIGKTGEDFASLLMAKDGYNILCRNYTCKGGEIDLIASKDSYICFVEVKLRSLRSQVKAAEAVDETKLSRIKTAANCFMEEFRDNRYVSCLTPRFDIIELYTSKNVIKSYNHITGIN